MNPGLRFLLRRSLRGRLRFVGRRMRTAKGAVSVVGTGIFLLLVVGVQLAGRWMGEPGLSTCKKAREGISLRVETPHG